MADETYPIPCPFCAIAVASPPAKSLSNVQRDDDDKISNVVLSTRSVLAFLDIMPLSKGHLLVIPRTHYQKLKDVGIADSMELGKWLPILSRVVMKVVLGNEPDPRGDDPAHWNVLQNNGIRASQTVPHVHFHIVPRPPIEYGNDSFDVGSNRVKTAAIVFGKGQRDDLDDGDAEELARALREELAAEIERVKSIEGVELDADFEGTGTHDSNSKIKL